MKNILLLIIAVFALGLFVAGCSTTTKTTVNEYCNDGTITKSTETITDTSDFASYMASGDGCATTLSADVSKFSIGWNGYGINWFSVSGVRVKAPKDTAKELDSTAGVIKATKVSVQTDDFGINTEKSETKE